MDSSEAVRRIDASAPLAFPCASRRSDEPGLGRAPELVGLAEGLLGLGELAEAQPDLAELVEGGAGDARAPAPQLDARRDRRAPGPRSGGP